MSGYNRIIIMGNLTRTPECKQLPSGMSVCNMSLATSRTIKTKSGENPVNEVCFVDIAVWGNQAESCQKYLDKGSSVLVEGRLKLDSWNDQNGNKRSKHTIVADRVTFIRGSQNQQYDGDSVASGEIDLENNNEAFKDELPF